MEHDTSSPGDGSGEMPTGAGVGTNPGTGIRVGAVPDADAAAAIHALADRVGARDGAPPLSDQALTRLDADGVTHVLARAADGRVVGYAQRDGASAELLAEDDTVLAELLTGLLAAVRDDGAGELRIWSHGQDSPVGRVLADAGFVRTRALLRLRRGTEGLAPDAPLADGVTVRAFEPGRDEQSWLAVNAAAFAHHPEQGGWTLEDVRAREREPWFDRAGLLVAERAGVMIGFHWTKIHPDGAGEVYVLAVDPGAQGLGLGAALLTRGLNLLASRGCPRLLLYVDESNVTAVRLYERAGFTVDDVDSQWEPPTVADQGGAGGAANG